MFARFSAVAIVQMALVAALPVGGASWAGDTLYVGDAAAGMVRKFDAETNQYLGALAGTNCYNPTADTPGGSDDATRFWKPNRSGPCQPFGMIVNGSGSRGQLYVANGNNQVCLRSTSVGNIESNVSGDVMRFSVSNGHQLPKLVSPVKRNGDFNLDAPYGPRGTLLYKDKLYVADVDELDPAVPEADADGCNPHSTGGTSPGSIKIYNPGTGALIGKLLPDKAKFPNINFFHPRGMVIKDGLLYVAVRKLRFDDYDDIQTGGWVLRFDLAKGKFKDVFISSDGSCPHPETQHCNPVNQMNRPEGIVFGPDGNIYVASFRADPNDNDKILIFSGRTGRYVSKIDLARPACDASPDCSVRGAWAQALLFGPHGRLYVPISGGEREGDLRVYPGTRKREFDVIIRKEAGQLASGWYLTFGRTNPATLEYDDYWHPRQHGDDDDEGDPH